MKAKPKAGPEGLWMTWDWSDEKQGYIGIITDVHPRRHQGKVTVLSVEVCPTKRALFEWFATECVTRPWETRQ